MKLSLRIVLWLLLLTVSCSPLHAFETRGRGSNAAVVTAIDSILAEPALKGGMQGVLVQSLSSGKTWYERNADLYFIPASNQKLLTTSAVLGSLGPDWTFTTVLLRRGEVDGDGTLKGDLYLKGTGDPLLESKHLDGFAQTVKAAGIRKVEGRLVGDDTRFEKKRLGLGWEWDDLPFYYAPEVSGLNLNKNLVSVTAGPGPLAGDPLTVTLSLPSSWATVTVRGTTGEKGRPGTVSVTRGLGANELIVEGALPEGGNRSTTTVTVTNPTRYALAYLAEKLKSEGIEVSGGTAEGKTPGIGAVEIAQHRGEPLSEVLKKVNKPSDNLIAECLLKALGAEKGKDGVGSWKSGSAMVAEWFKANGIDPAGIVMEDGSGLSRHNFVTPRSYAQMLKTMHLHAYAKVFKDSLPVAGVDGTLKNRPIGPNAKKSCRAKTGTVSNVVSLSGYVDTKAGEPLLFVILMNNHQCSAAKAREVQDRIVEAIASVER